MERTISAMVGKGSFRHNSREFTAKNVDGQRTQYNIEYCNEDIKSVYHELFDEALERYNSKQTRSDRRIDSYFDKIRTGKQEKLFHEVIFQIGNKDDTNAKSESGKLAADILDEFMSEFQERNPNLKVFSAHLHMDEETPHLHIDFVPFTTGSKRGLDTRVSLKKALAQQGFKGGTRSETEWKQWITAEKEQLSRIMTERDIQWKQLGTKDKHLSVLDFEKKMRSQEITALEQAIQVKSDNITLLDKKIDDKSIKLSNTEKKYKELGSSLSVVERNIHVYEEDKSWQLPEVSFIETASHYKEKKAKPLIQKFINMITATTVKYCNLKYAYDKLKEKFDDLSDDFAKLREKFSTLIDENKRLKNVEQDFNYVKRAYGKYEVDTVVQIERERDKAELKKVETDKKRARAERIAQRKRSGEYER